MEEVAEVLAGVSKPRKIQGIRWVDHKKRAMAVMGKNWQTCQASWEYRCRRPVRGRTTSESKGVSERAFKFVLYQQIFQDILNEVAKVSLLFPRGSVVLEQAIVKLESATLSLTNQASNHGHNVREFYNSLQGEAGTLYKGEQLTGRAVACAWLHMASLRCLSIEYPLLASSLYIGDED